jgi:hypothetical protein
MKEFAPPLPGRSSNRLQQMTLQRIHVNESYGSLVPQCLCSFSSSLANRSYVKDENWKRLFKEYTWLHVQ